MVVAGVQEREKKVKPATILAKANPTAKLRVGLAEHHHGEQVQGGMTKQLV